MHQQTSQFPLPYSVDINHTAHTPSPTACVSPPLRAAGRIEGHGTTLWRVASLQARELAALEVIAIYEESSGTQVMNTIRDKFKKSKINCFLNLVFLFRQQALLEGNIRIISHTDMEAQIGRVRIVGIRDLEPNSILTEAFHHPAAFAANQGFVSSHRRYEVRLGANFDDPIGVLVVGWITRKEYLGYCIGAIILLSVVIGVLVGSVTQSASLGLTISSGLGTVLSCVEALVCWQFR